MRNPMRHIEQHAARTLTLICLASLLAFAGYSWMPRIRHVLAEGLMPSGRVAGVKANHAPLKLRPAVEGDRSINFGESRDLQAEYVGSEAGREALESGSARPTALASSDFDEDGMPDLLSGYASPSGGGIITLRRGNVDSVYPSTAEVFVRKKRGEFVDLPFLSPAMVFELAVAPEFLGAGDFDADGHWDVVAASKVGTELHVLKGDGRGGLALAQRVTLPGQVTAMVVGEINRADGLADIIVGVDAKEGARALVFESPEGAMKAEPEVFDLPGTATALALGLLDDHYAYDLAIAAGSEVQIIDGRDRKLSLDAERRAQVQPARVSRHSFASEVKTLAIGDFTGEGQTDLAVLTADGSLQVMRHGGGETRGRGDAETRGPGERETGRSGDGEKERQEEPAEWQVSNAMSVAGVAGEPQLIATSVSPHWENDLLLLDGDGGRIRVVVPEQETSYWKRRREGTEKLSVSPRLRVGASLDGAAVAALPMRLNMDGLSDVVVLQAGQSEPSVLQTEPTITFTVNSNGDQPDANPGNGQCLTANNTCTLRAAIEEGNALAASAPTRSSKLRAAIEEGNAAPNGGLIQFFIDFSSVFGLDLSRELTVNFTGTIDGSFLGQPSTLNGINQPSPMPGETDQRNGMVFNAPDATAIYFEYRNFGNTGVKSAATNFRIEASYFAFNERAILVAGVNGTVGGTVRSASVSIVNNDKGVTFEGDGGTSQGNNYGVDREGNAGSNDIDLIIRPPIIPFSPSGGEDAKNSPGDLVTSSNNIVGGTQPGAGNVITNSRFDGVQVFNNSGNLVQGNSIVTNLAWGININNSQNNTIGGTTPAARNVISGNGSAGFGGGINLESGADYQAREFNRAFVFMLYLGYLRRRPNDPPDMNFDGYNFWLAKLNQFNGNFIEAEMVKAFIRSGEYRGRFGP